MTRDIEKERAEFEAWLLGKAIAEGRNRYARDDDQFRSYLLGSLLRWYRHQMRYSNKETQHRWEAWQAARRAPVVPMEITKSMRDAGLKALNDSDPCLKRVVVCEIFTAMLAVAPQPPEACNPSMQPSPELATKLPEGQSNCASLEQLNENNRLQRSENPTFKSAAAPVELPEPGQRPPLTLEQIQKALGVEVTEGSMPYAIARAIERAIP